MIKNQVRRLWSVHFNTCYCQWYNLNEFRNVDKYKRCDDFYKENFPTLELKPNHVYCDDLVGFSKEVWGKQLTPHAHEAIQWAKDSCN